ISMHRRFQAARLLHYDHGYSIVVPVAFTIASRNGLLWAFALFQIGEKVRSFQCSCHQAILGFHSTVLPNEESRWVRAMVSARTNGLKARLSWRTTPATEKP